LQITVDTILEQYKTNQSKTKHATQKIKG
jgi:hypothetical protein